MCNILIHVLLHIVLEYPFSKVGLPQSLIHRYLPTSAFSKFFPTVNESG